MGDFRCARRTRLQTWRRSRQTPVNSEPLAAGADKFVMRSLQCAVGRFWAHPVRAPVNLRSAHFRRRRNFGAHVGDAFDPSMRPRQALQIHAAGRSSERSARGLLRTVPGSAVFAAACASPVLSIFFRALSLIGGVRPGVGRRWGRAAARATSQTHKTEFYVSRMTSCWRWPAPVARPPRYGARFLVLDFSRPVSDSFG